MDVVYGFFSPVKYRKSCITLEQCGKMMFEAGSVKDLSDLTGRYKILKANLVPRVFALGKQRPWSGLVT